MKSFKEFITESPICAACEVDPCICDDGYGFIDDDIVRVEVKEETQAHAD